jgi:hypothetical protein
VNVTHSHLVAAAEYLRRCRRAGDTRPVLEVFLDILSEADARAICAAIAGLGR